MINCRICKYKFYAKPSHIKKGWGKYCSKNCQNSAQKTGSLHRCFHCDKNTYRTIADKNRSRSGKFFCSRSCQTIWRNSILYTGKNHSNWRGGSGSYRKILMKANSLHECAKCKCMDKRVLAVHHKDRDRKNNSVSNLIWLCHNCHFLVHRHKEEQNGFVVPVA